MTGSGIDEVREQAGYPDLDTGDSQPNVMETKTFESASSRYHDMSFSLTVFDFECQHKYGSWALGCILPLIFVDFVSQSVVLALLGFCFSPAFFLPAAWSFFTRFVMYLCLRRRIEAQGHFAQHRNITNEIYYILSIDSESNSARPAALQAERQP